MKYFSIAILLLLGGGLHARIDVVASNAIIADWLQQVGGEHVRVTTLAGAGTDPHHFSPAPRDVARLAQADLVVAFSPDMESWLERFLQAGNPVGSVLYLNEGLDLMATGEPFWIERQPLYPNPDSKPPCCQEDARLANEAWAAMIPRMPAARKQDHHHDHDHDHAHHHADLDPHAWLDPQLALLMILEINHSLNQLAPPQSGFFDKNRENYLDQLIKMDEWAQAQIDEIPVERRLLVTYHDNLRYLARRYGLFTPASILGSISTETADPSARQFAELLRLIEFLGAPAIFVDATSNPRLAEQAARQAGLPPPVPLYTDNLTNLDGPAPDYLSLMRYNVTAITNALL